MNAALEARVLAFLQSIVFETANTDLMREALELREAIKRQQRSNDRMCSQLGATNIGRDD